VGVAIHDLTIRYGNTLSITENGGGIDNAGVVTLTNVSLISNTSRGGGAIYNTTAGSLSLSNVVFMSNTETLNGGGAIWSRGLINAIYITLTANSGSFGGGIYSGSGSTTTLMSAFIGNNQANSGAGGLYFSGRVLSVTQTIITGNQSIINQGGGLFVDFPGKAFIANSMLINNQTAGNGGGIYNAASIFMTNTTLSNNVADSDHNSSGDGGGLYNSSQFSINGGSIISNSTDQQGGGISNSGPMTLTGVNILSNTAGFAAGGIYNTNQLLVSGGAIAHNIATQFAAGIYNTSGSFLSMSNARIESNRIISYTGGGIYNAGLVTSSNSLFISNTAQSGAGIFNDTLGKMTLTGGSIAGNISINGGGLLDFGVLSVTQVSFISNTASAGGALDIYLNGKVILDASTIFSNTASNGGGIYSQGQLTATNSTISANSALGWGGGVAAITGSLRLSNVTIVHNLADSDHNGSGDGGGLDQIGSIYLANTILADNEDWGGQAPDCYGAISSLGYNLILTTTGCTINGTLTGIITNSEPLIGSLQNNGGSTWTHALLTGSPAIDAGDPAGCKDTNGNLISIDQRGQLRPSGAGCDLGAYEFQFNLVYLPVVLK
jgi:fibronectin-binding autotransporter adhesin